MRLSLLLGQIPGKQHSLSDDYFDRIESLQYAIANDDGQRNLI